MVPVIAPPAAAGQPANTLSLKFLSFKLAGEIF
jgi:hypothetical protein